MLVSVLTAGLPGVLLTFFLLWISPYSLDHKTEGAVLVLFLWLGLSFSARERVVNSMRVLANVVSSLKEEDFSIRATGGIPGDALGDLALAINELARAIETERLGAMEAGSLLRKVITEVEAAIFAVSPDGEVKLINRAAAAFLDKREDQILNRSTAELGIHYLIEGPPTETITRMAAGIEKSWIVRRANFRQQGKPHHLVLLSEASEVLRAVERQAWQRMVRVLSHEINNSLAPIKSIARTLLRIPVQMLPDESRENFKHGLEVISSRAESLNRFLQSYARMTRLPAPARKIILLEGLLQRVAILEARLPVTVIPGPPVRLNVDPDQLEQVLINICKNAVESVQSRPDTEITGPAVEISWSAAGSDLQLWIRDQGVGLADTSNLFVPFYTTKETGAGIGLVLSRQIIEAHGGNLIISNRSDVSGCQVEVKLPGCVAPVSSGKELDSPFQE